MKKVIINRGIVGSGKSHNSKNTIDQFKKQNPNETAKIVSADNYFMVDGEYKFNPAFLSEAHIDCMKNFISLLECKASLVIVDNTNTQIWEYTPYLQVAHAYGYEVEIIEYVAPIEVCLSRQTHGVPEHAVRAMADRFEKALPWHEVKIQNTN